MPRSRLVSERAYRSKGKLNVHFLKNSSFELLLTGVATDGSIALARWGSGLHLVGFVRLMCDQAFPVEQ